MQLGLASSRSSPLLDTSSFHREVYWLLSISLRLIPPQSLDCCKIRHLGIDWCDVSLDFVIQKNWVNTVCGSS